MKAKTVMDKKNRNMVILKENSISAENMVVRLRISGQKRKINTKGPQVTKENITRQDSRIRMKVV